MAIFDIYAAVTDRIIRQLEQNVIPWEKPWGGIAGGAISGTTGKPYSLLNQMLLSKPGAYFTYNQIQKQGGNVRKGERSHLVVFWRQVPVKEQDPHTGEIKTALVPMLRYYNVFHIDQCEGISTPHISPEPMHHSQEAESIISDYICRSGVELIHQVGDEAYYSPARDRVVLPTAGQFVSMAEYYSTAFHELAHSTGHQSRLNRLRATAHFGSESYSKEELVAEISAAALLSHTGLETGHTFKNSTAYIQNWLSALRNDKRLIVTASGAASKAVSYILGLSGDLRDNSH